MDDTEDDAGYPPKRYSVNHHSSFNTAPSSNRQKLPVRNASYALQVPPQYDVVDEEEDDEDNAQEEDELDEDDDEEDDDEDDDVIEPAGDSGLNPKKRKLRDLVNNYEFAPRVVPPPTSRLPFGGRNSSAEWTEHETFLLLEAWGERFVQLGRKSLRSDDWADVAEKVSEGSKIERTDMQCRNRLDTLKKKYKKERAKVEEIGGGNSKWVFYKKMDALMGLSPTPSRQQYGLACGVDSGEYVFMNPRVYLNRSNGLDEMRDSPGNSEYGDDDSEGLPLKRTNPGGDDEEGSSIRLLADSIEKFGEIYEKIEKTKRQQMMELEKMRMDFHRELELRRKEMLERTQAEIAKIRQGDDEDTDASDENYSG